MKLTNHDAERAILASLANESAERPAAAMRLLEASRLEAGDFSLQAHADAFSAAQILLRRNAPVDMVAMQAMLESSEAVRLAGGRKWLVDLLWNNPQAGVEAAPEHARIIRELSSRRFAIQALKRSAAVLADLGVPLSSALTEAQAATGAIVARKEGLGTAEGDVFTIGEQLSAIERGERQPVLPTGIGALDCIIGGLQPTLTILGALPGVGKSALIATIAKNLADAGKRIGLFSLEDERTWVAKRLIAAEASVPMFVLCNRPLTEYQRKRVDEAGEVVYKALSHMVIDDRQGLTPAEVVATARDMILNHGVKAIFVDHLGELRYAGGRSERFDLDIAEALSDLRGIAKQYGVPVLVACHVRRRDGLLPENEPRLTDFANSSAIERMARVALALSKTPDGLKVSVLKQTNGQSGVAVELEMLGPAGVLRANAATGDAGYEKDEENMLRLSGRPE